MKKMILPVLVLLTSYAMAQTKKPVPSKKPATATAAPPAAITLKDATDSLSYAIGVLDGTFFKQQGISKVNPQAIGRGFSDVISGKPVCSPEAANEIVRREMQKMTRARVQPNIDEGKKFLAENKKKAGIHETPSGLQYEVIREGNGPKPADTSTVRVHYEGFLLNGLKVDSSRDRGEPVSFSLNQVIRGWQEALQLMPVGSVYKFYIPYYLGYGEQGSGETIPGGSTLIFEIELLGIVNQ